MKKQYRLIITVFMVMCILLCGCSRKVSKSPAYQENSGYAREYEIYDDDYVSYAAMGMDYAAEESAAVYESKAVPSAANSGEPVQKRMVRKSASINIQVMDPLQTAQAIITLTEQMGGFVVSSSSSQERYNGDVYLPKANLSIRVPSEKLQEMLDFIENQTTDNSKYVSNKKIYGVDITSDYVDTNSRLTSLEKTRDKLYEIMDKAENAEEALEVYNSIADVESEIEVLKGQIKYMEESVALSSVEIVVSSIKPAPISTVQKWDVGDVFKNAFETLLDAGKSVIEFLIYFIIVIIPILVLVAIPVILIFILIKKLIRKKKAEKEIISTNNDPNGPDVKQEDVLASVKKD